ncbi:MAG: segregation/condensation protein A [Candidatus Zapsychrus exili]|nr:segregation/condensation protein A [Candidatus Zapsychrus exili]
MSYKLNLDIFEGPLDLLLYLIKKNDLDISDISIAEITGQYMQYIEMMKILNLDLVGDFLVMAATLMQIKSRMLLPKEEVEEEEEVEAPEDELIRRLNEYKRFKEIAGELKEKESDRRNLFSRVADQSKLDEIKHSAKEIYFESSLFDLINALSDALKRAPEDVIHEIVKEEYTVEQKIHDILHLLLQETSVLLKDVFKKARTKSEIIVTFLAVLELIRLKEIKAIQKELFSDIEILRNKENFAPSPVGEDKSEEGLIEEESKEEQPVEDQPKEKNSIQDE